MRMFYFNVKYEYILIFSVIYLKTVKIISYHPACTRLIYLSSFMEKS